MSLDDRIKLLLEARAARVQARSDGWQDLERRLEAGVPERAEPIGVGRPIRRLATAALAFAVFAAAGLFVWHAFKSGPTIAATYPSPPGSGYWVIFPDQPTPRADAGTQGVEVIARTNLPDGTLYSTDSTDGSGGSSSCCDSVKDGLIGLGGSNDSCLGLVGAIGNSPGLTVTVTISVNFAGHSVPMGVGGGEPLHQPDSVLKILGPHFERLTGDQVVERDGDKALVASKDYAWPEPQCGSDPFPLFGGPTCDPANEQLQGDTLREVMGEVMGTLSQARMCDFWKNELPPDVEAQHPWPEFAAQWRDWFLYPPKDFSDAHGGSTATTGPFTWHLTSRQGDHYVVDVTDHGQVILTLQIDALPDFCPTCASNIVPFWGVEGWTLH